MDIEDIPQSWRVLIAGGMAGAMSRTMTAPLDRMKIFMQVQEKPMSLLEAFRYMKKEGGWRAFWRGNGANVTKIVPETAIKFMVFDRNQRWMGSEGAQLRIFDRFVAGAVAGIVSQSIVYPLELLKTRLALGHTGQFTGIIDAARQIATKEGMRAFYQGFVPNMIGIIPFAGIDLAMYETLKKMYLKRHPKITKQNVVITMGMGAVSSCTAQIVSYPLLLLRTQLQAQIVSAKRDKTMMDFARLIYQHEGFLGFFRGIKPCLMKVVPALSISYVVYEEMKKLLRVRDGAAD